MTSPTIRVVAASVAFRFLAAASVSHADTQVSAPAQSAAPGPPSAGPGDPARQTHPPKFTWDRPPTPVPLELMHQSPENDAPRGYKSQPNYVLIIVGAATFGMVYLAAAGLTAVANHIDCNSHYRSGCGREWAPFVPVAGPIIHLAQSDQAGQVFFGPILVIGSLAQLAGLTMLVVGSIVRERVPITASASLRPRYRLDPYVSTTGGGLQALVRF